MRDDRESLWSAPTHQPNAGDNALVEQSKTVIWSTKPPESNAPPAAEAVAPDASNRDVQSARASVAAGAIAGLVIGATGHNALDELMHREKPGAAGSRQRHEATVESLEEELEFTDSAQPATEIATEELPAEDATATEDEQLTFTETEELSFVETEPVAEEEALPTATEETATDEAVIAEEIPVASPQEGLSLATETMFIEEEPVEDSDWDE